MRKNTFFTLIGALSFAMLPAATVRLLNDSPFPLSATILSATGDILGRQAVKQQEQIRWQNDNIDVNKNSQSPFTVIFYCPDGTTYGTVTNVSTGGMVQASTAHGNRMCNPKKKDPNEKLTPEEKQAQEKKEKETDKYFDSKENPDVHFQPKPINPDQWNKEEQW